MIMTIKEVKNYKHELEKQIEILINKFENETKLIIKEITMDSSNRLTDSRYSVIIKTVIEL